MKLEVLPAAKGDCLLLHHTWQGKDRLILIDGGPAGVYTRTLKPRLTVLRDERIAAKLLSHDAPLLIDLVIVSHIDDDHINGILALLEDIAAGTGKFKVGRLWHNGFEKLLAAKGGTVADLTATTGSFTASLADDLRSSLSEDYEDSHEINLVLASVKQGFDLLALAKKLKIPVNPEFGEKTIEATDGKPLTVDGLKFTVIGPLAAELDELRAAFAEWLKKRDAGEGATASLLASFSDKSVANLSSIVLLVEQDGKRLLLTGDARGDKFMAATRTLGLLDESSRLPVDIFKVPHHGSDRNLSTKCFEQFPAPYYVISGDGEHGNPERATLEYLAAALAGAPATLELTYAPGEIDRVREQEHNEKRGPKFEASKDGIVPFLETLKNVTLKYPAATVKRP